MNIVIHVIHIFIYNYPHSYPKDELVIHTNLLIIHNLLTIVHKYECSLLTSRIHIRTNKNGNRQKPTISIIQSFQDASSMPGLPFISIVPRFPLTNIAEPAAAIIAALSVHREIGGT